MAIADGWIGVDLDGTLAHYDHWRGTDHVGAPIKGMCDRVRGWIAEGKTVKIFTARVYGSSGTMRELIVRPIERFCISEFGKALEVTCEKDFAMIELWDDRAVQVVVNTGRTLAEEHESEMTALRGAP